jgi:hypothetical protein
MKGKVVFIARGRTRYGLCRNYKFSFFKTSLTPGRLQHDFLAENRCSIMKKAPSINSTALFENHNPSALLEIDQFAEIELVAHGSTP